MKTPNISGAVVKRLPVYLRFLSDLQSKNVLTVSSQDLGIKLNLNPAQIRKDLACFGEFGKKGIGYDVPFLIANIRQILNLHRRIPIVLVGAGNLGRALCNYNMYFQEQMNIIALFDLLPDKIGQSMNQLEVLPMSRLREIVQRDLVQIGIIAVPAMEAQAVANQLVDAGVKGILNFAPVVLRVPQEIRVHYVDFTTELQSLAFYLSEAEAAKKGEEAHE